MFQNVQERFETQKDSQEIYEFLTKNSLGILTIKKSVIVFIFHKCII